MVGPARATGSYFLEVTFPEVRTHLGVETQRQWSDLAIARTTPVLRGLFSGVSFPGSLFRGLFSGVSFPGSLFRGLFSWITLAADALQKRRSMTQRRAAWYDQPSPTCVDAIALVRRQLWLASEGFHGPPPTLIRRNSRSLCTTDL